MMKTAELKKILEAHGCYFVRNGNHEIWFSPITNHHFPVPRHSTIARYTARDIFKQAGINHKF